MIQDEVVAFEMLIVNTQIPLKRDCCWKHASKLKWNKNKNMNVYLWAIVFYES